MAHQQIIDTIISKVAEKAFDSFVALFSYDTQRFSDLHLRIRDHSRYAYRWSETIHQFGWAYPIRTENGSIKLTVNRIPRKYISANSRAKALSKNDIFSSEDSYLILGDPGSGKTTTIKRFVNEFYGGDGFESYNFPIVIKASEVKVDIFTHISNIFGLKYDLVDKSNGEGYRTEDGYSYIVSGISLKTYVIDFLRSSKSFVFIDGIDECRNSIKDIIFSNLKDLSLHKDQYGLMASCRSGDYTYNIERVLPVEISLLSEKEQHLIIDKWCVNPALFKDKVYDKSYSDLLNRPLFLANLINIFEIEGEIPDKPSDIYERILFLSLERWDRERDIRRITKYSGFSTTRKLDFLSAFSYWLLIEYN